MKAFLKSAPLALFLSVMITLGGCQEAGEPDDVGADTLAADTTMQAPEEQTAVAQLEPTQGNNVQGTTRFVSLDPNQIQAAGTISGLEPGEHGIHIHQNGDCSNNAEAAGPHWSGQGTGHGAPSDEFPERHAGDMGNLEADQSGTATFEQALDLSVPLDSLAGKAVIVHATRDDLETDPSGNSGARVACGVIEMAYGSGMGADTTGM